MRETKKLLAQLKLALVKCNFNAVFLIHTLLFKTLGLVRFFIGFEKKILMLKAAFI